jgi:hypothetical protein
LLCSQFLREGWLEVGMNGTNDGRLLPTPEDKIPDSAVPQKVSMDVSMEILNRKSFAGAEKFTLAMERFSGLSTEMITLLMGLSEEINSSAKELNVVRAAVDRKKKELEELQEAEQTARALKQQTGDLIIQKEELERRIVDQRKAWEDERARKALEEDEQRKAWNAEQFKARQELEEELQTTRRRHQEAQEEAERDFVERDMILKKKELEWSQLIQELDQFMSKLTVRLHPHPVAHILPKEETVEAPESSASGIPLSGYFREETDWRLGDIEPDLNREEPSMWDNVWDEKDFSSDDRNDLLGHGLTENARAAQAPLQDSQIAQNGRADNSETSAKKENAPLKFAPKSSNSHAG